MGGSWEKMRESILWKNLRNDITWKSYA